MNAAKKDYVWNTIGVLLQNAVSPILLIVVTRVNGVFESGIFSFAFSVALLFWAISIWGGRTYQVSDLKHEFLHRDYIALRICLSGAIIFAAIIFCLLNSYDLLKSAIIIVFVMYKSVESIADAVYGVLQVNNKLYITGVSLTLKFIFGSAIFIILDFISHNLLIAALGLFFTNLLITITFDTYQIMRLSYSLKNLNTSTWFQYNKIIQILIRCAPIAAVLFLSMFSLNIPRYFLDRYHPEELGYFGILVMPITVLALLITFLLQPNIVGLTKAFATKSYDEFIFKTRKIASAIIGLGLVGAVLGYTIGIPILNAVFSISFDKYRLALLIVIVGAVANGFVSLFINLFTIMRHFKALFYVLIVSNILLAIVAIPVVNAKGLLGAVGMFTIVNILQFFVLSMSMRFTIKQYQDDLLKP